MLLARRAREHQERMVPDNACRSHIRISMAGRPVLSIRIP